MIPVEQLTEEKILKRIDSLPQRLQEALDSEHNVDIVNQICTKNHLLDEEKAETIRQIAAMVLLGFLHSYDVAQEINEYLNLNNPQLAREITNELDAKVFSPLKDELENNFRPLMPEKEEKLVAEIMPPALIKKEEAKTGEKKTEVPLEVKPVEIKIEEIFGATPPSASGRGTPSPITPPPVPSAPSPRISPTELFGAKPKEPPAAGPAEPAAASGEPKPTMLHEEAVTKPLRSASGFSIEVPLLKLSDTSVKSEAPPLRPALLELGIEPQKPEVKKPLEPQKPRVVHYTEFRTPLGKPELPAPPQPENKIEAGREIKEITIESRPPPLTPPTPIEVSKTGTGSKPAMPPSLLQLSPKEIQAGLSATLPFGGLSGPSGPIEGGASKPPLAPFPTSPSLTEVPKTEAGPKPPAPPPPPRPRIEPPSVRQPEPPSGERKP